MPVHEERTRAAYDVVAEDYELLLRSALAECAVDRAVLGVFAEAVRAAGNGPVVDVGCGPGRITTYLHALGLDVRGIDLSPGMVRVARRLHPQIRFDVGTMAALDLPDASLGGLCAWYSVIHTPPQEHPAVFSELARVLRPGAPAVLAFQVGTERRGIEHAYGHDVSYDAWRLTPDVVERQLADAGITVRTRVGREPEGSEPTPQGYLVGVRD